MDNFPRPRQSVAQILTVLGRDRGLWAYAIKSQISAPGRIFRRGPRSFFNWARAFDWARWTTHWPAASPMHSDDSAPDDSAPRVVCVVSALGDVATLRPIVEAFRQQRPGARILFSVKLSEAVGNARELSDETVLATPFDHGLPVARWHARAQPDVVFFYQYFNYVTLLRSLWLREVPFAIVQARFKTARGGWRARGRERFKAWQLRGVRAISLAAREHAPNIHNLAPESATVQVVGSLKFPQQRPQIAPEREAALHQWIRSAAGEAPLLIVGSTREDEESWILDAFQKLRHDISTSAATPKPVLMIAPRHVERAAEIARLIEARGLSVSRRLQASNQRADVLLLDTLGELATAYQWASAAFVGGTITQKSQNVTEPLIWSIPVAYGPKRGNFEIEQKICEAAGAGFRVHSPDELAAHWAHIIQSPELRASRAKQVETLLANQRQAFDSTVQMLIEVFDAATSSHG